MNKIIDVFTNKKAFIAFITGGDPDIQTTENLIYAMAEAGADIIEIGIPFSDPIAGGLVIQEADERALSNGCTTDDLFELVKRVRQNVDIPLVFMTYINPVFTYGKDRFFSRCQEAGIDGVIVPDTPFEEKAELSPFCEKYGVQLISMITPTSENRIQMIAEQAEGFLYCVASLDVRGNGETELQGMINKVREVSDIPCAVDFAAGTHHQVENLSKFADGVISSSAIVSIVQQYGKDSIEEVRKYVSSMKNALV